jgi:RNA polymerase sigma-70 factor, ECF subfamily
MQAINMGIQNQIQPGETFLVQSARKGDVAAFNRLALDYQDTAYNLAYYLLGSQEAAETATQRAMTNAYQNLKTYPGNSFRLWLLRCLLAACREGDKLQAGRKPGWSRLFAPRENCLQPLTFDQRILVLLIDVEGLSYAETAWVAGKPVDLVCSGLAEARQRLTHARNRRPDPLVD